VVTCFILVAMEELTSADAKIRPRKDDEDSLSTTGQTNEFGHPVFKRLSQINGAINKLKKEELKEKLEAVGLNCGSVSKLSKHFIYPTL